jgi:hypothetical protein
VTTSPADRDVGTDDVVRYSAGGSSMGALGSGRTTTDSEPWVAVLPPGAAVGVLAKAAATAASVHVALIKPTCESKDDAGCVWEEGGNDDT